VGGLPKIVGSSFRLIISFAANCVTVGINPLKQSFTSEFEISRGADFEHFRKVSHLVTPHVTDLVISKHIIQHSIWSISQRVGLHALVNMNSILSVHNIACT